MVLSSVPTLEMPSLPDSDEHTPWPQQAVPSATGARHRSRGADRQPLQAASAGVAAHLDAPRPDASVGSGGGSTLSTLEEQFNSAYASRETTADSSLFRASSHASALATMGTASHNVGRRCGTEVLEAGGRRHPLRGSHPEAPRPSMGPRGAVGGVSWRRSYELAAATGNAVASPGSEADPFLGLGAGGSRPRGPPSSAQQQAGGSEQERRGRSVAAVVSAEGSSAEAVAGQRSVISARSADGYSPCTAPRVSGPGRSPTRPRVHNGGLPSATGRGAQSRVADRDAAPSPQQHGPQVEDAASGLDGALPRESVFARFAQQRAVRAGDTGNRCCSVQ